jgi:hypothetical protein
MGGSSEVDRRGVASADLVSRSFILDVLRREQYDERSPSGASHTEAEIAHDLGYRKGHNDRARSLIALLEEGRTVGGLRELRNVVTELQPGVLFEATTIFSGEGG